MKPLEKLIELIGPRKHISKEELVKVKEEFGEDIGGKIYEIAGKGSRLSKAELIDVAKLFEVSKEPIKKEIEKIGSDVEKVSSNMDIIQNEKILWLEKQIGQIRTSELGYMGEQIHKIRENVKSLEKDISYLANTINKLNLTINSIE